MQRISSIIFVTFCSILTYSQSFILDSCTFFIPQNPNGTAIICCPGGGYETVCDEHEGKGWATEMNEMGITWIVVNYNLPKGNPQIPFKSIERAMQTTHSIATQYGIDTSRIGIAGFSAGGHLAATYTRYSSPELRPAFQILFYPVISMNEKITHQGSRNHLLGEHPTHKQIKNYSLEKQHSGEIPPTLIFVSENDGVVPIDNSRRYTSTLKKKNVPHEIHIFPIGSHGWGNSKDFEYHTMILQAIKRFLFSE